MQAWRGPNMGSAVRRLRQLATLLPVLVLLSPVLVHAATFSPFTTSTDTADILSRGAGLQASARAAAERNFTCTRDSDYLNWPK
jgi:hypothetical protein